MFRAFQTKRRPSGRFMRHVREMEKSSMGNMPVVSPGESPMINRDSLKIPRLRGKRMMIARYIRANLFGEKRIFEAERLPKPPQRSQEASTNPKLSSFP